MEEFKGNTLSVYLLLLVFFSCSMVQAQNEGYEVFRGEKPVRIKKDGKYGFKAGVTERYQLIGPIPAIYDSIQENFDSIMIMRQGKMFGIINAQGEEILPAEAEKIRIEHYPRRWEKDSLRLNYIVTKKGKEFMMNFAGTCFNPNRGYDRITTTFGHKQIVIVKDNGKYGLLHFTADSLLLPLDYNKIELIDDRHTVSTISDRFIAYKDSSSTIYDFQKKTKVVVPYIVSSLRSNKWLIVNKSGKVGIMGYPSLELKTDIAYSHLYPTYNNRFWLYKKTDGYGEKVGVIDTTGKVIVDYNTYDYINVLRNHNFMVVRQIISPYSYSVGVYNEKGEITVPIKYQYCKNSESFCFANEDENMAFYDHNYKRITPFNYKELLPVHRTSKVRNTVSYLAKSTENKYAFISIKSNKTTLWEYDSIFEMEQHRTKRYITINKGRKKIKKGLINLDKKKEVFVLITEPKYASIEFYLSNYDEYIQKLDLEDFGEPLAVGTKHNGKKFLLSKTGKTIKL